jgi:hypothetical protein
METLVRYLPPFEIIKGMLNLTSARGKTRVDMTYEDLQKIIRILISAVEVDEAFYLSRNPDVADGIRKGGIRSAREHFVDHGYFEGRLPYQIEVDRDMVPGNAHGPCGVACRWGVRDSTGAFRRPGLFRGAGALPAEYVTH